MDEMLVSISTDNNLNVVIELTTTEDFMMASDEFKSPQRKTDFCIEDCTSLVLQKREQLMHAAVW